MKIGRFEIVRRLGAGSVGAMYMARDPHDDRLVAVKIIAAGRGDEELRQRVAREAHLVARLRHPNVAAFVDAGEDHGQPFIAYEYITGESLQVLLRRDPPPAFPIASH